MEKDAGPGRLGSEAREGAVEKREEIPTRLSQIQARCCSSREKAAGKSSKARMRA